MLSLSIPSRALSVTCSDSVGDRVSKHKKKFRDFNKRWKSSTANFKKNRDERWGSMFKKLEETAIAEVEAFEDLYKSFTKEEDSLEEVRLVKIEDPLVEIDEE